MTPEQIQKMWQAELAKGEKVAAEKKEMDDAKKKAESSIAASTKASSEFAKTSD